MEWVGGRGANVAVAAPRRLRLPHGRWMTAHEAVGQLWEGHNVTPLLAELYDAGTAATVRVLTLIVYANDAWEEGHGGCLRLHLAGGARDVAPRGGRCVVFFSDSRVPHEVLPVAAAARCARQQPPAVSSTQHLRRGALGARRGRVRTTSALRVAFRPATRTSTITGCPTTIRWGRASGR